MNIQQTKSTTTNNNTGQNNDLFQGWSLDDEKMYYQDSPLRTVSAFDFDAKKGVISEREEV